MNTDKNTIAALAEGVTFVRADGKADLENKELRILNPAKGTIVEGDVVTGIFKKAVISPTYGSTSYLITTDDEDLLINGCGSLNKQMAGVAEGELVRIEYRGAKPMKDGKFKGKNSHLYTVLRATASSEEESAG